MREVLLVRECQCPHHASVVALMGKVTARAFVLVGMGLAVCLAAPGQAAACSGGPLLSGMPGEPSTYEEAAEVIFTGTAVRTESRMPFYGGSTGDPLLFTFIVDSVEKGQVGDRFTVVTAHDGAACGYPFELGQRYRVLAWTAEEEHSAGYLRVYSANGTRPVEPLPNPPPIEGTIQPLPPMLAAIVVLAMPVLLVGSFVYFFWRIRPRE